MRVLGFMFLALGALGILISLPLLGFAALGYLGILADVGPLENRDMGLQLLMLGLPALICGLVLGVVGIAAMNQNRRRADAEPGAPEDEVRGRI